jgi:hypothetical protein
MNTTIHIAQVFIEGENAPDYEWTLRKLADLMTANSIPPPQLFLLTATWIYLTRWKWCNLAFLYCYVCGTSSRTFKLMQEGARFLARMTPRHLSRATLNNTSCTVRPSCGLCMLSLRRRSRLGATSYRPWKRRTSMTYGCIFGSPKSFDVGLIMCSILVCTPPPELKATTQH